MMAKKMNDPLEQPIMEIEWNDAASSDDGWLKLGDRAPLTPMTCRTVGYLLKADKKHLTVTTCLSEDGHINYQFTIPMAFVRSAKVLRRAHRRK